MFVIRGTQGKNLCFVRNTTVINGEEEQVVFDTTDTPGPHHLFDSFHVLANIIRRKDEDFGSETHPWKWELVQVEVVIYPEPNEPIL